MLCRFITVQYSKQTDGPCHRTVQSLNCSVTWPKRQSHNHCSSFRTFTFWRPKKPFHSRGTKESFVSILARQTVPIGLDDPQSVKNISELCSLIDLFGGAKNTSVKRGASKPLGTVLTSANFTPIESVRHA